MIVAISMTLCDCADNKDDRKFFRANLPNSVESQTKHRMLSFLFVFIIVTFRTAGRKIFSKIFTSLIKACNEYSVAFNDFNSFRFSPMYLKVKG
jgi:hypothetical protein